MSAIRNRMAAAAAGVLVTGVVTATGNTYTWNGTTNNWTVSAYWGGTLPGAGDTGIVASGSAIMNADLTNSPTIQINTGGIVKSPAGNTPPTVKPNLILNGGTLLAFDNAYDGGNFVGGTALVQNASTIAFNAWAYAHFTTVLTGSGNLLVSNNVAQTGAHENWCPEVNGHSPDYTGQVRIGGCVQINNSDGLGTSSTIIVDPSATFIWGDPCSSDCLTPVTLNGGLFWVRPQRTWNGAVNVVAPSRILANYYAVSIGGQISGSQPLTIYGSATVTLTNTANSAAWSGGLNVTNGTHAIKGPGCQGSGPITMLNGATLKNSGTTDFTGANAFSNNLSGVGTLDLNGYKIAFKGSTITPGGAGTVGVLTNKATGLCLSNSATLAIDVVSATSYDVLQYAPSASPKSLILTGATLVVSNMLATLPSPSTYFYILRNSGDQPVLGTFSGLPEGATINLGGSTNCAITYKADFEGDGKTNDVALYNFSGSGGGQAPQVDNYSGATNIYATRATLCGNVSQGTPVPDAYVCWGRTAGSQTPGSWQNVAYATSLLGPFSKPVTGLAPTTTYYYCCFATNSAGGAWSSVTNFTTTNITTYTWTGTVNNWTNSGCWSPIGVPGYDSVCIVAGGAAIMNADLVGSPTVWVNTNGTVMTTASFNPTPNLILNGGTINATSLTSSAYLYGSGVVQAASAILFSTPSGSYANFNMTLEGAQSLTGSNLGTATSGNGDGAFFNVASPAYSGIVYVARGEVNPRVVCALGTNNSVNVSSNGWLVKYTGAASPDLRQPIVLNGGTYCDGANGSGQSGSITLTAPSSIRETYGNTLISGPIYSSYPLTLISFVSAGWTPTIRNTNNIATFTGGLIVSNNLNTDGSCSMTTSMAVRMRDRGAAARSRFWAERGSRRARTRT